MLSDAVKCGGDIAIFATMKDLPSPNPVSITHQEETDSTHPPKPTPETEDSHT